MGMPYYEVRLRRTVAVIEIDVDNRTWTIVECSNERVCRSNGIESCPPYCELVVAAKDYAYGRRKPKAQVLEITQALE